MNILILGSSGQIGAHLVEYIRHNYSHEVITFDLVDDAYEDLRWNNQMIRNRVHQADVVLFLAFDVGGSVYLQNYQHSIEFLNNNVKIMKNTFTAIDTFDRPVIFASSQMADMNWSPYGVLKRLGEFYTRSVGGINVRFWNVYGHEYDEEKTHVITDFVNMAFENNAIVMRTTGEEERQFLHADDASRGLMTLVNHYDACARYGGTFDMTSGEWVTILEIAEMVKETVGCHEIIPGSRSDSVQGVKNEPNPHMKQLWTPEISLSDGIRDIADWYARTF